MSEQDELEALPPELEQKLAVLLRSAWAQTERAGLDYEGIGRPSLVSLPV